MVNKASPILLGFPKAPAQSSEKIMKACHTPFGHKSLDCYERILLFLHNSLFSSSSSANNDDFFSTISIVMSVASHNYQLYCSVRARLKRLLFWRHATKL